MQNVQAQLEAIEVGNGFNAFQVLFWLLVAWAVWMYFGDKIKVWFQSFAAATNPAGGSQVAAEPASSRGIDALHAMLTANGWTPEEADKLVADNVTRIRTANVSKA